MNLAELRAAVQQIDKAATLAVRDDALLVTISNYNVRDRVFALVNAAGWEFMRNRRGERVHDFVGWKHNYRHRYIAVPANGTR